MSLLFALIIGASIGGVVGYLLIDNADFLILNIVIGIVGSILGLISNVFLFNGSVDTWFSWMSILCSIIGALVLLLGFDTLHRIVPQHAANIRSSEEDQIDED